MMPNRWGCVFADKGNCKRGMLLDNIHFHFNHSLNAKQMEHHPFAFKSILLTFSEPKALHDLFEHPYMVYNCQPEE